MEPYHVLHSAQVALLSALDGIGADHAESKHPVHGTWNLKQLMSHLVGQENLLGEALSAQLSAGASIPNILKYRTETPEQFSQSSIDVRKDLHYEDILAELNSSHDHVLKTLYLFTPQMLDRSGTLSWYAPGMSVAEYIKLAHYDHKLMHAAEIAKFKAYLSDMDHIPTK